MLSACGSGSDETKTPAPDADSSESTEKNTVDLVVTLTDSVPLEVYRNLDDRMCTSDHIFSDATVTIQVTVKDAGGQIVGTGYGPNQGGRFSEQSGCAVAVPITVPASDFYEVSVTGGSTPLTQTVQTNGSTSVDVEVSLD